VSDTILHSFKLLPLLKILKKIKCFNFIQLTRMKIFLKTNSTIIFSVCNYPRDNAVLIVDTALMLLSCSSVRWNLTWTSRSERKLLPCALPLFSYSFTCSSLFDLDSSGLVCTNLSSLLFSSLLSSPLLSSLHIISLSNHHS